MTEGRIVIEDMHALLRHRAPFLFVDEGEVSADGTRAWGRRTFTADEAFFEGHFPGDPIVPGVVLLEFVAQTANFLMSHRAGRMVQGYLVGVDEARFNISVRPGQTVVSDVRFARDPSSETEAGAERIVGFKASVLLDGKRCVRAAVNIYQGA
jgi:3-hydroxyacyl-[acyl-carrier-protein] dehydratase